MELPVTLSPPVKAYPAYGLPLSILSARDDRFDPWLLGQFITVVGERGGYSLLKAEYDWMYTAEGVFKYHRYRLPPEFAQEKESLWTLLTAILSHGQFILGVFNEKYIREKPAYRQKDQLNSYMITGFDPIRRTLSLFGSTRSEPYTRYAVPYTLFLEATLHAELPDLALHIFSMNPAFIPRFDPYRCIRGIETYLSGTAEGYSQDDWACGIKALEHLHRHLPEQAGRAEGLDPELFGFLAEHKQLMERRVRALLEWRSPCGGNETVCRGYGEAVRLACQVAADVREWNKTRDRDGVSRCHKHLGDLIEMEKRWLPALLKEVTPDA